MVTLFNSYGHSERLSIQMNVEARLYKLKEQQETVKIGFKQALFSS
jgi:hypothetical protein